MMAISGRASLACALCAFLIACNGEGGSTVTDDAGSEVRFPVGDTRISPPDDSTGPAEETRLPDLGTLDLAGIDLGPTEEQRSGDGELGDPCDENADCLSGFCVPSDIGDICTIVCIDDCPEGWQCKGVPFSDPDVIFVCMPTLERACALNGVCDAGTVEEEACGNCGERSRTCKQNCQWGEWSNCFGEGECVAGTSQEAACGNCGVKSRTCSEECLWAAWGECQTTGECSPGAKETKGCGVCGLTERVCTEACTWSEWGACEDAGECVPATPQEESCGNCGTRLRICTEQCLWSEWGECTNEGSCAPGETGTQVCGKCGTQQQTCTDACEWSAWGACEGQGICTPGETEDAACGNCGTKTRTCTDQCAWGPYGECGNQGICTPGEKSTDDCGNCGTKERSCTDQCAWSSWGSCHGQCVCAPDAMVQEACGNCGTHTKFCTQDCEWGPWGSCLGQGVCTPGTTKSCDLCGTQTCTGSCGWSSCNYGKMDGYENNDTSGTAYVLPGITDAVGDNHTITANINPSGDDDWYKIHIADTTWHNIDPKVTLSVPLGQTYKLCVTYTCDKGDKTYNQCLTVTTTGSVALDVGGCQTIWQGDDDSGTAAIQVDPLSSGSCSDYTLKIEA